MSHPQSELVEIFVGRKELHISAGKHAVSEIKQLADVPLAYELDEIVDGVLTPLPDDGVVFVKPKMRFVPQPRHGHGS